MECANYPDSRLMCALQLACIFIVSCLTSVSFCVRELYFTCISWSQRNRFMKKYLPACAKLYWMTALSQTLMSTEASIATRIDIRIILNCSSIAAWEAWNLQLKKYVQSNWRSNNYRFIDRFTRINIYIIGKIWHDLIENYAFQKQMGGWNTKDHDLRNVGQ